MPNPTLPEYEINWLYGMEEPYAVKSNDGRIRYPYELLPPKFKEWVRSKYGYTDFVSMGPTMGLENGMQWMIFGWKTIPDSTATPASAPAWTCSVDAIKDAPIMTEIEKKIASIHTSIDELNRMFKQYTGGSRA
jgi:hypothetical protein